MQMARAYNDHENDIMRIYSVLMTASKNFEDRMGTHMKRTLGAAGGAVYGSTVDLSLEYPYKCPQQHCAAKFSSEAELHR